MRFLFTKENGFGAYDGNRGKKGFLNSRVEAFTVGYEHVLNPVGRDGLTWSAWTGYRQGGHT